MLFGCFGRGHVRGRGASQALRGDALQLVEFMNGPCTCNIKAADTGLDLLIDWEWEVHLQARDDLGPARWIRGASSRSRDHVGPVSPRRRG